MLVYGRHQDEGVIIGDADTLMMQATPEDRVAIGRMLVSSDPEMRQIGQRLAERLGTVAIVKNTEQRHESARLGFTFPREIPVDREEIRAKVNQFGRHNVKQTTKAVPA